MSLNIYLSEKDIPEGSELILKNNAFFSLNTCLPDDGFTAKVLKELDLAERVSNFEFLGRNSRLMGTLHKDRLSTGAKTVLNIKQHPEKIFCTHACPEPVTSFIPFLTEGNIVFDPKSPFKRCGINECDILCNGIHFTTLLDFIPYLWDKAF